MDDEINGRIISILSNLHKSIYCGGFFLGVLPGENRIHNYDI